jgi:hypothetical protein
MASQDARYARAFNNLPLKKALGALELTNKSKYSIWTFILQL